jgi:hypothetical protein
MLQSSKLTLRVTKSTSRLATGFAARSGHLLSSGKFLSSSPFFSEPIES